MKLFLIVILLFTLNGVSQITLENVVFDSENSGPIAYSNILLKKSGVGVATNLQGEFSLVLPKKVAKHDSVSISCVGYATVNFTVEEVQNMDTIYLPKKTIELSEFTVVNNSFTAEDIIRIAIGRIKKNYNRKAYQLNAFYRHYCSEKDRYGRLIEAAVKIYDTKGHKSFYNNPELKLELEVEQVRRSYDYTENFDEHDAISINSTLKYDITSYESMLQNYPENWGFKIVDTTFYDNNYVWVISYNYSFMKNKNGKTIKINANGNIYINVSDFAIIKINEVQENKLNKEYEKSEYIVEWEVRYQKYQDKYFLSYISESGWNVDEKLNNEKESVSKKDHKFHVEMMVNAIVLNGFDKFKGKEPTAEELSKIEYNKEFWEKYTALKNTPLNKNIILDLEREKTLREQFND